MSPRRAAVAFALVMTTVACSKDGEVGRDLTALDAFGKDVVARVEGAKDPAAGLDAALLFVEQNREDMTARWRRVWTNMSKVGKEMQERIQSSALGSVASVNALRFRLLKHTRDNPQSEAKLDRLIDAYTKIVSE